MQFVGTILWLLALFVGSLSITAFTEDRDLKLGITILAVAAALGVIAWHFPTYGWSSGSHRGSNCYTDWDGRSNPTVCD
jgi:hypothetical protein